MRILRCAALLAGAALTVAVAGCTSDTPTGSPSGIDGTSQTSDATPPVLTDPSASGRPPATTTTSPTTAAAVTAGPLSQVNVPPPTAIGSTWATNASPVPDAHGSPDTSWLSARDPEDVAASLAPFGCTGLTSAPSYPVPAHALQGRYVSGDGLNAVVLVLDYGDEAGATALMTAMGKDIARCPPRADAGPQTPYTRTITVSEATSTRIRDSWVESGVGAGPNVWHEVVIRVGGRVGLADVEAPPGVSLDLAAVEATLDRTVGA